MFESNNSKPKLNTTLVISIIGGILATFLILAVGLNYMPSGNKDDNSSSSASNQYSKPIEEPVSTEVSETQAEFNEAFYTGLKEKMRTSAKISGVKALSDTSLSKDNIEVRLHLLPGFYAPVYKGFAVENSILILKRENMNWSGQVIRNVIKSSADTKEKITVPLNPPQSGWDDLWQKLQTAGVSAKPTKSETEVKNNLNLYVVESRENGNYTYSYFHAPKEKSPIEEEKRIAAIFNLIAKEFDVLDFKAS